MRALDGLQFEQYAREREEEWSNVKLQYIEDITKQSLTIERLEAENQQLKEHVAALEEENAKLAAQVRNHESKFASVANILEEQSHELAKLRARARDEEFGFQLADVYRYFRDHLLSRLKSVKTSLVDSNLKSGQQIVKCLSPPADEHEDGAPRDIPLYEQQWHDKAVALVRGELHFDVDFIAVLEAHNSHRNTLAHGLLRREEYKQSAVVQQRLQAFRASIDKDCTPAHTTMFAIKDRVLAFVDQVLLLVVK
jgi:hypothetical protein